MEPGPWEGLEKYLQKREKMGQKERKVCVAPDSGNAESRNAK